MEDTLRLRGLLLPSPPRCMQCCCWFEVCCQVRLCAAVTHSCGFLLHLWFQRSLPALFGHPFTKSPRRFNFSQKPLHTQLLLLSFACPCQLASKELCCSPGRQRGPWGCPQPTLLGQELCGSPGSLPAPSEPFLWCCFSSGRWEGLLPGSSFPICGSCLSSSPGLWFSHISWEGGGSVLP